LLRSRNQLHTAISRRKPFPSANEELRQISKTANQNYYNHLMDTMVDIPGLLHDLNNIRQAGAELENSLRDILARGKAVALN
jgi:hypothetical protein